MKTHNLLRCILLCLLFLTFGTGEVFAGDNAWWAKVTAHAIGRGYVYADVSDGQNGGNNDSGNPGTQSESTAGGYVGSSGGLVHFTFYAYPEADFIFKGWKDNQNGNYLANTTPFNKDYNAASRGIIFQNTGQNSAVEYDIYAIFVPEFYFSGTAYVSPAVVGEATVSPASLTVEGDAYNTTSVTKDITFTAPSSSDYGFLGWFTTEDGDVPESTTKTYIPSLTATTSLPGHAVNKVLYARFQPYATSMTLTPSSMELYEGDVTEPITYTLSPTGAYDEHTTYETNDAAVATVDGSGRVTAVGPGTALITVRSLKDDNSTTATSATVTVSVRGHVRKPVFDFAPTDATGATATVTITSATSGVKIYYTTDNSMPDPDNVGGSNPTQEYDPVNKPVLNDGQIIQAIAVKYPEDPLYDDSEVAVEMYNACTTEKPKITFEGDNSTGLATVTITAAEAGATIYYTSTTNGTTPTDPTINAYTGTGASPLYIYNVTPETKIKAIAKSSSCRVSEVASKTIIFTYIADGKVVLDDQEEHEWSYYSDPDCPIRSLSPADVKITYYGDGIVMSNDNDYTADTNNYVSPGNANYVGGAKVNVGGENENTFIYYKTLERGDATQTAWTFSSGNQSSAASRCPYTPIPNPFQVRPTYGGTETTNTADWAGWRGFQCWRLKSVSGGAVYSAASGGTALAVNAIVNAEKDIYFAPNSEYGMEVEFEAVWARAYVVKAGNGATAVGDHSSLGYERNFIVLNTTNASYNFGPGNSTGNTKRITNIDRQVTVTNYLPNGVQGQNNANTKIRGAAAAQNNNSYHLTLGANTKFENVAFADMTGKNLTAAGHNLIVGRGCTGTVGTVTGMAGGSTSAVNYTIRLESGTYNSFYLGSNNGGEFSGTFTSKAVFGCDYDRANGANGNLSITPDGSDGNIYGGTQMRCTSDTNKNNLSFDWTIKSGKCHDGILGQGDGGSQSIYLGSSQSVTQSNALHYIGKRRITIEGGELASIAGGMNSQNPTGTPSNYDNDYTDGSAKDVVTIRMKGGTVRGSIYGAAAFAGAKGGRTFVLTGGKVLGWIAGGANGTATSGGALFGDTYIYIGGETEVGSSTGGNHVGGQKTTNTGSGTTYGINGADGGNVFGAGCGILPTNNSFDPNTDYQSDSYTVGRVNSSTIAIADDAVIRRDVYGGGNYGHLDPDKNGTSKIYIAGGEVKGSVFGGSNNQQGQTVEIVMKDGLVSGGHFSGTNFVNNDGSGGIFGGSNTWGTIKKSVSVSINGGQVGVDNSNRANVFGGGKGSDTRVTQDVTVNIGAGCSAESGATIYGDVYGGSAEGYVNGTASNATYKTNVNLYKGTIYGSLYGGGLGTAAHAANVYGDVAVKVYGGRVLITDGTGENGSGSVLGCNNTNGAPQRSVSVDVYGTERAPGADRYALFAVYGGGNRSDYAITGYGVPAVTVHGCSSSIEYVYGGGNASDVNGTNVVIWGGNIGNVFAGGNGYSSTGNHSDSSAPNYNPGADILTNTGANVTIHGGTMRSVFGGSNQYGTIAGATSVVVESETESGNHPCSGSDYGSCPINVGELYGGGNEVASQVSSINIGCMNPLDEEIGIVYAGAKNADVTGDISMTITGGHFDRLFAGNNIGGCINGSITMNIEETGCSPIIIGELYTGGNQAPYSIYGYKTDPSTGKHVVRESATDGTAIHGWTTAYTSPTLNVRSFTSIGNIYGGGLGETAVVVGNPTVNVNVSKGVHAAETYVGKTLRFYDDPEHPTRLTSTVQVFPHATGKIGTIGNIFGGGNAAEVHGNTIVNIGTEATQIFVTPTSEPNEANRTKTVVGADIRGNVFGGGNHAKVTGTPVVTIGRQ